MNATDGQRWNLDGETPALNYRRGTQLYTTDSNFKLSVGRIFNYLLKTAFYWDPAQT